jgi:lactoylglutathione lyase
MQRFSISIFLIGSLLLAGPLYSQQMSSNQPLEIDHIALHVRDLQRSADFYQTIIGLERLPDPFKDDRHVFFRLAPRTELHLIAGAESTTAQDIDVHFALRTTALPAFIQILQEKHIKYFSSKKEEGVVTKRPDGIKQIYFQDPDGYWLEANDSRL